MLEAKPKNQGHRCEVESVLQKKGFQNFFSGELQKNKTKIKVFDHNFQAISRKNGLQKFFSSSLLNVNVSKNSAVLEPRTG